MLNGGLLNWKSGRGRKRRKESEGCETEECVKVCFSEALCLCLNGCVCVCECVCAHVLRVCVCTRVACYCT